MPPVQKHACMTPHPQPHSHKGARGENRSSYQYLYPFVSQGKYRKLTVGPLVTGVTSLNSTGSG